MVRRHAKVLAITSGDPCGIGPEIVARALRTVRRRSFAAVVMGDASQLPRQARLGAPPWPPLAAGAIAVFEVTALPEKDRVPGRPTPASGRAQLAYVDAALDAVLSRSADAMVTAPVSKDAIHRASPRLNFRGHTEYLAARSGGRPVAMMFHGPRVKVALVTTHLPLSAVPGALTSGRIVEVGRLLAQALRGSFGVLRPKIGVCALNPHAGEAGLLGSEEVDVIAPAVRSLRGRVARFEGPIATEAAFRRHLAGELDALVALYHDQATLPCKLLDFGRSVNVTLGLPFVRTSVDHGVAYDIAGTGTADPSSMRAAILLAARIA